MIRLDVSAEGINEAIAELSATEEQARKALNSTMGKMAAWLRTRAVRGLSDKLKLQQKILRARLRTYRISGSLSNVATDGSTKVWLGLNDISLARLKPRETAKGVTAMGGRFVEGAFIAKLYGKPQVLKRVGKSRAPLEVQKAKISDEGMDYIENDLVAAAAFDRRFLEIFERELKWRTSTRP
jgi:hypothetical protein